MIRTIQASQITDAVTDLFLKANRFIGDDVLDSITSAMEVEPSSQGKAVLNQLIQNYEIAKEELMPVCQDTGMAVVFIEIGQDVHIANGGLEEAINEGVRQAYEKGYLRKSVVGDPLFNRTNTKDNTPAIIYPRIVPGDKVHILAVAKGFGSENMSALKMLVPADGIEGVKKFILQTVENAGPNPCPPIVVGVGIGGTFELAALMAKRMTAAPLTRRNKNPEYAALEDELLEKINKLGIGPAGIGGQTTALKVNIASAATHIAGLPVAVNICCHAARHAETTI